MRHIPNILSGFRLLLVPFFVWQMLAGHTLVGGILLLVSGITDMLDGMLARRFGWVSDLGKVLDPAADKLTQVAAFLVMAISLRRYWVFFVVLTLKEALMAIGALYLMKKGIRLEGAHWYGKVSTVVFYAVIIVVLLFPGLPVGVVTALLGVATAVSVIALLLYIPAFFRHREKL